MVVWEIPSRSGILKTHQIVWHQQTYQLSHSLFSLNFSRLFWRCLHTLMHCVAAVWLIDLIFALISSRAGVSNQMSSECLLPVCFCSLAFPVFLVLFFFMFFLFFPHGWASGLFHGLGLFAMLTHLLCMTTTCFRVNISSFGLPDILHLDTDRNQLFFVI